MIHKMTKIKLDYINDASDLSTIKYDNIDCNYINIDFIYMSFHITFKLNKNNIIIGNIQICDFDYINFGYLYEKEKFNYLKEFEYFIQKVIDYLNRDIKIKHPICIQFNNIPFYYINVIDGNVKDKSNHFIDYENYDKIKYIINDYNDMIYKLSQKYFIGCGNKKHIIKYNKNEDKYIYMDRTNISVKSPRVVKKITTDNDKLNFLLDRCCIDSSDNNKCLEYIEKDNDYIKHYELLPNLDPELENNKTIPVILKEIIDIVKNKKINIIYIEVKTLQHEKLILIYDEVIDLNFTNLKLYYDIIGDNNV